MVAITQTRSLLRSVVATLSWEPPQSRTIRVIPRPQRTHPQPIRAALFRDALVRERARADRFEESFMVARMTLDVPRPAPGTWDCVLEALPAVAGRGDLIGWIEPGITMGILRPGGSRTSRSGDGAAADAMCRDLQRRLAAIVPDCSVTADIYDPTHDMMPPWLLADLLRLRPTMDVTRAVVKRLMDVVVSVAMLVILAPLMAAVALLVKCTSPGPVLFRQERVGSGGRRFRMNKFRTIRVDADDTIHQQYVERFIEAGARKPDGKDAVCKLVDDPRVTRIGRVLRRWSIDELPQLWNVLVGDMSLVGPRPALPYEVARYKTWHRRRMDAIPGITGLWQVSGRSQTSFDEMVQLDLRYARNCTILNDLKILLATPRAVLSGRGAH